MSMEDIRFNWTRAEIGEIYHKPLLELILAAADVHRRYHTFGEVQVSSLLSIKTGGCSEDCAYCPQAARYHTGVKVQALMKVGEVVEAAKSAKAGGASRFCMGAAWREVRDNRDFDRVLEMVQEVNKLDMEVCCTLGMLTESQAKKLADAGLYAYNHNIDTSPEYYREIATTRTMDDRLETLDRVRKGGIRVCCGGILGMGEEVRDRIAMLVTLATLPAHPDSVPINLWNEIGNTPVQKRAKPVDPLALVRTVALARILMPESVVRLSAGRTGMSEELQALCFLAGANSIFVGDALLTTGNPAAWQDEDMIDKLGMRFAPAREKPPRLPPNEIVEPVQRCDPS